MTLYVTLFDCLLADESAFDFGDIFEDLLLLAPFEMFDLINRPVPIVLAEFF